GHTQSKRDLGGLEMPRLPQQDLRREILGEKILRKRLTIVRQSSFVTDQLQRAFIAELAQPLGGGDPAKRGAYHHDLAHYFSSIVIARTGQARMASSTLAR